MGRSAAELILQMIHEPHGTLSAGDPSGQSSRKRVLLSTTVKEAGVSL